MPPHHKEPRIYTNRTPNKKSGLLIQKSDLQSFPCAAGVHCSRALLVARSSFVVFSSWFVFALHPCFSCVGVVCTFMPTLCSKRPHKEWVCGVGDRSAHGPWGKGISCETSLGNCCTYGTALNYLQSECCCTRGGVVSFLNTSCLVLVNTVVLNCITCVTRHARLSASIDFQLGYMSSRINRRDSLEWSLLESVSALVPG